MAEYLSTSADSLAIFFKDNYLPYSNEIKMA
jgi:hypothetical protein